MSGWVYDQYGNHITMGFVKQPTDASRVSVHPLTVAPCMHAAGANGAASNGGGAGAPGDPKWATPVLDAQQAQQQTVIKPATKEAIAAAEAKIRAVLASADHNEGCWYYVDPQVGVPLLYDHTSPFLLSSGYTHFA
jgi:hypothetical protein